MADLRIQSLTVGPFQSACFLLFREGASEAIVVDPGDDPDQILAAIDRQQLRPVLYVLTHGHIDHVAGLAAVAEVHPAPVALHPADGAWAFTERAALPPFYPDPPRLPPGGIDRELADGQTWTDAGITYRILETPGHSPGGVCAYLEDEGILIAGDCLFQGGIGRTDLPGASAADLSRSLDRILELPDETTVYPGHGPATTIGDERRSNPFLRDRSWAG